MVNLHMEMIKRNEQKDRNTQCTRKNVLKISESLLVPLKMGWPHCSQDLNFSIENPRINTIKCRKTETWK